MSKASTDSSVSLPRTVADTRRDSNSFTDQASFLPAPKLTCWKQPIKPDDQKTKPKKTQAELDKELQLKMQGLSGDGGESGVEYEDGQPVSMKRSVKDNMFRYI